MDSSSTPGSLKTTCVPLELWLRPSGKAAQDRAFRSRTSQAHGTHSNHTCHYEPKVRAEIPLLAPQWPPPAPIPRWSHRDKGGPRLHLHSSLHLLFTEATACISALTTSILELHCGKESRGWEKMSPFQDVYPASRKLEGSLASDSHTVWSLPTFVL